MDTSQQGMPTNPSHRAEIRHKAVTGAATAVTAMISLALVHNVLITVANWRSYLLVHDYLAGRRTAADVLAADSDALANLGSVWVSLLAWTATGITWLVWLWRARGNSELMSGVAAHRRSRGWVVGGWMAPVANLWIPYQVVSDVWRASAPRRPVSIALINAWWVLFAVASFVVRPLQWRASQQVGSENDLLTNANLSTLLTALYAVAGLLIIFIVRRITEWQNGGHAGNAA